LVAVNAAYQEVEVEAFIIEAIAPAVNKFWLRVACDTLIGCKRLSSGCAAIGLLVGTYAVCIFT
jgi:hypothetical protein